MTPASIALIAYFTSYLTMGVLVGGLVLAGGGSVYSALLIVFVWPVLFTTR